MRRHLTYANVMASIAVFVALGGASYAAIKIPANSVGSKQLKKSAVIGSKIKARAIRGSNIAVDTVLGANIKESTLTTVPRAKLAETATKATAATTAASATTAKTATAATTAATAQNAEKVGGLTAAELRQKCPAGAVVAYGLCVELKTHATTQVTYPAARQACSDFGGRTPTAYELDAIRQRTDIEWAAGQGGTQYEWTSSYGSNTGATPKFLAFDKTGTEISAGSGADPSATYYYRCVTYPSDR